MSESNQEGYRALGWIINESEQGLYLVVADEDIQKEIVDIYRHGSVHIYNYKRNPGVYSFRDLQEWILGLPEAQVFIIANFHLAIQEDESLKRLNFSRDMLERLGKNIIFLVTPYGDDQLAAGAYDFYSFVKLRITFHDYETKRLGGEKLIFVEDVPLKEDEWEPDELKRKLAEANLLIEQAKDEKGRADYNKSLKLLTKARTIKEKIFGTEHLEVAEVLLEVGEVYERLGRYQEAQKIYEKSLQIREQILGEEHPDTARGYNNLAGVYGKQGKYQEAVELYEKSLRILEQVLGEEHPDTAGVYNNLAGVYNAQGDNETALFYYLKAYMILFREFGSSHPHTQIVYKNMKSLYDEWKPGGDFELWLNEEKECQQSISK